jgi:NAD-dependent dihydropyrimidine dehydrogenase PreA subunit
VPVPCTHCREPECARAATSGAVYVREDGAVIIDPKKAVGQRQIAEACPIGAVYWNEELNLPQKCTLCAELLDEGFRAPRCVDACPNGAMHFGDLDDQNSEVCRLIAENRVTPLPELNGTETNVIHLNVPTVFFSGSVYLPEDEVADGGEVTLTDLKTGETRSVTTNCFGDWEFEWLEKDARYEVRISLPGWRTVTLEAVADTDHFLGEVTLEKA